MMTSVTRQPDNELAAKLAKRLVIEERGANVDKQMKEADQFCSDQFEHPYPEYSMFSVQQVFAFEDMFKKADKGGDSLLDYSELKWMMEDRGTPMTHLELKYIIKIFDEDGDSKITMKEFLNMWMKVKNGELPAGSGLAKLVNQMSDAVKGDEDVSEKDVGSKKTLFEAKVKEMSVKEEYSKEKLGMLRKHNEEKKEKNSKAKDDAAKKKNFSVKAKKFENLGGFQNPDDGQWG